MDEQIITDVEQWLDDVVIGLDPYAGSDWVQTAISLTKRHFMFE